MDVKVDSCMGTYLTVYVLRLSVRAVIYSRALLSGLMLTHRMVEYFRRKSASKSILPLSQRQGMGWPSSLRSS